MDRELKRFSSDMLESIRQMKRGARAQTHLPEEIKTPEVRLTGGTAALRSSGPGWQTRVNEMLRREVLSSE